VVLKQAAHLAVLKLIVCIETGYGCKHVTVTSTLATAAPIRMIFKCHCWILMRKSAEFDELE